MGIASWLQMPLMSGNIWRYQELELFWQIKLIKIFVPNYQLGFFLMDQDVKSPGLYKDTAVIIWWTGDICASTWGMSVFGGVRNLEWFFNIMEHAHFSGFQKPEYSSFAHLHPLHSYIGSCLQQYLSVHFRKALFQQRRPPLGHINHCESSWLRNGLCFLLLSTSITHLLIC